MSERVDLTALYPSNPQESDSDWTKRILSHAREHRTNRQCSIGYHGECSDRFGETCNCLCHDDAARWFTVEGHPDGDLHIIHRVKQGKQSWPPAEGEPAGTWAHWIIGTSPEDAKDRAIAKQEATAALAGPVKAEPGPEEERPGVLLTREQLEAWAGRGLSDEEVEAIEMAIPNSSIPEAISILADTPELD